MSLTPSRIENGEWFRFDRKSFVITIGGTPADKDARFQIMRQAGGEVLLEKTSGDGITFSTPDYTVVIGGTTDEELLDDYALLPAGYYWWTLTDTETPLLIGCGDVVLGEGLPPS